MKKYILYILLITFSVTVYSQNKVTISADANDDNLIIEKIGNQINKGYLDENGKRTGCWREYNHQDILKGISEYSNGILNGVTIKMDQQGNLNKEMFYINGKLNGEYREYLRGLYIIELANYKEGILHGKYYKKYENNPKISMEESFYKNGNKHGVSRWYTDKGILIAEYLYNEGKFEGANKTFYENGKIMIEEVFENNIPISYTEYYENGKIKLKGEYKDGKKEGVWVQYSEDGSSKKLKYQNGELK
ncbi:MAG: toxin-antitoxin system YwqK family antitoxin [Bacteroidales bacterium]